MAEPLLKSVPRVQDIQDLFNLNPTVIDLDDDGRPDGFDAASKQFRYRFFRGCSQAPFINTSDRFQALNAWYLSDAAFLAYANDSGAGDVAKKITPPLGRLFASMQERDQRPGANLNVAVFLRNGDRRQALFDPIQCYAVDDGAVGIVAFRGTLPTSIPNWLTDFDAAMTSWRGASGVDVHAGFAAATLGILEDDGDSVGLRRHLRARLQAAPNLKLWFTGHSLGAALATLAAYDFGNVQALYTYGSPRVGNPSFAHSFARSDVPHYRVVHHHDIVPQVPIPLLALAYQHVGDLKYIEYEDATGERTTAGKATAKLFDGLALEHQLGAIFASLHDSLCDALGRLKIGFLSRRIDLLTDHAPLYYSNILWNSFVKERARLLGQPDPQLPQ